MVVLVMAVLTGTAIADDGGVPGAGPATAAPVVVPVAPEITVDAGAAAAMPVDAASPPAIPDAGAGTDAGNDAGIDAGGAVDAGVAVDAGGAVDAGSVVHPGTTTATRPTSPTSPVATAPPPATPAAPKVEGNRSRVVIKLVLGFMLLFVVAYVGSHRRVVAAQERLGIGGVIAAGFPFIALGLIVRQPEIGILTHDVVDRMRPILHFGLGWLGFIIGAQLDIRLLDRVPRGTAYLIVVEAMVPFAATAAACGACAVALGIADLRDQSFWRDLILLGAAAAMTAPRRFRGFANRGWREGRGVDQLLGQLDEIVGVLGLLFVAAYFRPETTVGWQIPGTAWVFVSIGLGVVVGVLIFAMVRVPVSSGEFLAVVVGSVAFGSGLAGYLYLSPIVVCFIAGALVTNFPCEQREDIFRILNHLERPIHLLFLIVAGATWSVTDPEPWVIVPVFVVARVAGKWMGVTAAHATVGAAMPRGYTADRVLVSPLSPLSIALVLSLHGSAGGAASDWIITIVIAGAMLTEVAVQFTSPPVPLATAPTVAISAPGAAVDELDEASGPTYRDGFDDEPTPIEAVSHPPPAPPAPPRSPAIRPDPTLPPLAPRPRTEHEE
jgi:Kef-type K+ transport system membrane component KefB